MIMLFLTVDWKMNQSHPIISETILHLTTNGITHRQIVIIIIRIEKEETEKTEKGIIPIGTG